MKLLVRLDSLVHPRTGIGYYTEHLVRHLLNGHPSCKLTGLYRGELVTGARLQAMLDASDGVERPYVNRLGVAGKMLDAIRPVVRGLPGAYAARQKLHDTLAEKVVASEEWDIYHEPSFIPLKSKAPTVITVHDLSHIRFPQYHPKERVKFLNRYLGRAIKDARQIITVSQFTQDEVCHFFPEAEGKTTAIPLGVDAVFRPRTAREVSATLNEWGLDFGQYVLSVATQEPRKNLSGLIEAYLELPPNLREKTPLVLVGGKGWRSSEFTKMVEFARRQPGRIVLTGRLSRQQLAELTSGCRLFAYPSFYEGFGLPIAEALASGVPVLTTNYGAMREVAGQDAVLVDPNNFAKDLHDCLLEPPVISRQIPNHWCDVASRTLSVFQDHV